MTWLTVAELAAAVSLGINAYLLVYLYRLLGLMRRLDMLLMRLCIDAFRNQHLPIWVPWAAAYGVKFAIDIIPAKPQRSPGTRRAE